MCLKFGVSNCCLSFGRWELFCDHFNQDMSSHELQSSIPIPETETEMVNKDGTLPVSLVDNDSLRKSSNSSIPNDTQISLEEEFPSPKSPEALLDPSDVHFPYLKQNPMLRGGSAFWFKQCSMVIVSCFHELWPNFICL
jgi:hypothetical protein